MLCKGSKRLDEAKLLHCLCFLKPPSAPLKLARKPSRIRLANIPTYRSRQLSKATTTTLYTHRHQLHPYAMFGSIVQAASFFSRSTLSPLQTSKRAIPMWNKSKPAYIRQWSCLEYPNPTGLLPTIRASMIRVRCVRPTPKPNWPNGLPREFRG